MDVYHFFLASSVTKFLLLYLAQNDSQTKLSIVIIRRTFKIQIPKRHHSDSKMKISKLEPRDLHFLRLKVFLVCTYIYLCICVHI